MLARRRSLITVWTTPLGIGLFGLYHVSHSPGFDAFRAVDIVQLLASGACFGATFAGLMLMLRGSRP